MSEEYKQLINKSAWHAEDGYDEGERVRLSRACEFIQTHAPHATCDDRQCAVLDIGCGVGPLREWLGSDRFNITGMEISPEAAAEARNRYDACLVADIETAWPVEAETFDAVHAGAVMEHVLDWHAPLNHAGAALRVGGVLVVSVPSLRNWSEIKRLIKGRQPHWIADVKHLHAYTPRFLTELLRIHGFELIGMEADKVRLPLLPAKKRWVCQRFAAWGSVLIVAAALVEHVRVEDGARKDEFKRTESVGLRSIRVLEA
jgi:2-polyprenyl-3-methyl-5-hydroxy-6-metoxy-1,4-benzoquinol methylase